MKTEKDDILNGIRIEKIGQSQELTQQAFGRNGIQEIYQQKDNLMVIYSLILKNKICNTIMIRNHIYIEDIIIPSQHTKKKMNININIQKVKTNVIHVLKRKRNFSNVNNAFLYPVQVQECFNNSILRMRITFPSFIIYYIY